MYKPSLEKIDEVDTPIGHASVLNYGRMRLLSFPSHIDQTSKISMRTYYGTLQWPKNVELRTIADFLPGPALPGYLLLTLEQLFVPANTQANRIPTKKPWHISVFVGNVLASIAASLIAGR